VVDYEDVDQFIVGVDSFGEIFLADVVESDVDGTYFSFVVQISA